VKPVSGRKIIIQKPSSRSASICNGVAVFFPVNFRKVFDRSGKGYNSGFPYTDFSKKEICGTTSVSFLLFILKPSRGGKRPVFKVIYCLKKTYV
jgi:hypothetical protein